MLSSRHGGPGPSRGWRISTPCVQSAAEEALLHQRLFVPEAEQPPGPTTVLDDLVAENLGPAGATGDPQPVAASTVPFMSDMLMDFDMDSNF